MLLIAQAAISGIPARFGRARDWVFVKPGH
jgi:hypothetical protein